MAFVPPVIQPRNDSGWGPSTGPPVDDATRPLRIPDLRPVRYPKKDTPPTKDFQEKAKEYIAKWCKASRTFVRQKVDHWKMLDALYMSQLGIMEWQKWRSGEGPQQISQARATLPFAQDALDSNNAEGSLWQSNFVYTPGFMVDCFCDQSFAQLFAGTEWLSIICDDPQTKANPPRPPDPLAPQDPTSLFNRSERLQHLMLMKLGLAKVESRAYEALQTNTINGTVFGKVFWHERNHPEDFWEVGTDSLKEVQETGATYEYPVIQTIPLDRILPDRAADHNDISRWSGIGHTVDRLYEEVLAGFEDGTFNLNKKDFTDRWDKDTFKGNQNPPEGRLYEDRDSRTEGDDRTWLQLWEWHGKVPYKGELIESVAVIVTERSEDDPSDGVLVSLRQKPILPSGTRPFVCAHFTQRPGAFGVGLISREEDLLFQISQFIGQMNDNSRLTSCPVFEVDYSSPAYKAIMKNGGVISPGMVIPKVPGDPNSGITAAKLPPYPNSEINSNLQLLTGILERRTNISDTEQGIDSRSKTATEASILQAQGAVPLKAKVNLFARNFLEPAINIALEMVCEFSSEDQAFTIRGANNQDIPVQVSLAELKSGKFRAAVTLLRQDHTSIAKAQSIERALPILSNVQPLLAREGVQISFNELITRYLDLIGIESADRIIQPIPPQPPQPPPGPPGASGSPPSSDLNSPPPGMMNPEGGPPGIPPPGTFGPGPGSPPLPGPGPDLMGGPPMAPVPINTPPPLIEHGGPLGQSQDNTNAIAQFLQLQALRNQGGMP